MRYPAACISTDIMGLLPFAPAGVVGGYEYPALTVGYDQLYRWWFRVKTWRLTITLPINPDTSISGNTSITYSFTLTRDDAGGTWSLEKDRVALRPGTPDELRFGPSAGPFAHQGRLDVNSPGDDVFVSINWIADLSICGLDAMPGYGGSVYPLPASRYAVDTLDFLSCIRLSIRAPWDDGAEKTFYLQTFDPTLVGPAPVDLITTDLSMEDLTLPLWCVNFSPNFAFGGPPVVTLAPDEYYECTRSDGSEAIFDRVTGAVLSGQSPLSRLL